jgi:phosphatidylserine/phosphatidylglycerophosphate/cardiolipin synthase-like enzyme
VLRQSKQLRNSAASVKRIWIPVSSLLKIFTGQFFEERQVLKGQRSEKYTSATFLRNAGIPTYIDGSHAIAHNNIIIIDKIKIITVSFNFTKAAEEKNAKNVLIIRDKALAKIYIENWEQHKGHSEPF